MGKTSASLFTLMYIKEIENSEKIWKVWTICKFELMVTYRTRYIVHHSEQLVAFPPRPGKQTGLVVSAVL